MILVVSVVSRKQYGSYVDPLILRQQENYVLGEKAMTVKLLKTWKYKAGYHVRYEEISGHMARGGPPFVMRSAYTPDGQYIGSPKDARFLVVKMGIRPEKARPENNVCSVGFCEKNQKWYGWSHRAIADFGIGDKLFEANWPEATDETPFVKHGSKTIVTLDEARQAAVNFAAYVS